MKILLSFDVKCASVAYTVVGYFCGLQRECICESPHRFFYTLRLKNSCHEAKWPSNMTPYSEISEKIKIEMSYLPCHCWFTGTFPMLHSAVVKALRHTTSSVNVNDSSLRSYLLAFVLFVTCTFLHYFLLLFYFLSYYFSANLL